MVLRTFLLISLCLIGTVLYCQNSDSDTGSKNNTTVFYPAMSLENPLSSGRLGLVVLGANIENRTRIANEPDGNAGVYIGLGDPEKFIGAGTTINIYGLSNKYGEKDNIGEGGLSFHLNKLFFKKRLMSEVGVDNAVFWGSDNQAYISYQRSFYFSENYLFYLKQKHSENSFGYVSVTFGAGNGYYRRDKNYTKDRSGSFDPFFSLASPLFKGTNIITEWNGYDVGLGISSIPLQKFPFVFTLEVTDLVYGKPRIASSVSFPFNFINTKKGKAFLPKRPVGVRTVRPVRTI